MVGLFAVAELFSGMETLSKGTAPPMIRISGKLWLTREEWRRSSDPWVLLSHSPTYCLTGFIYQN
jgi:putative tricarboxylic transport membrane protein